MKKIPSVIAIIFIACLIVSCARNPYAPTNRVYKKQSRALTQELKEIPPPKRGIANTLNYAEHWVGTTNFNLRKPNIVVIHHTAQDSVGQTLKTFTLERTQVSSHYVIGENGEIYQMLNDLYRAWHGGSGQWGSNTDLNSSSIGIELDNNGIDGFSPLQIASLMELLKDLKEKYKIPTANFIGHSDIAPTRKNDPNKTFPWKALAKEGYGLWYDDIPDEDFPFFEIDSIKNTEMPQEIKIEVNDSVIVDIIQTLYVAPLLDVSPKVALKIIGYDVSDMPAAIKAFKLHFIQTEVNSTLTDYDLKVLNNLYKKYL
ncbi:N-acetylmuramoyl-L-alanine amidase [Gelidibacter algens]|uniref:N-acetylmuramoyl-L-alanine amidase n=1 Tax=Gelidibacter algens TaxID=49280 RepID=A0A1A7R801_9FLAO|nr:N-acetylmuramoyl-L-alanine amidase [Gelidibacter algens]OBX26872.1 N-acetylmuramoyl-L-alanine amidase [Gelidibacter algens]RAJ26406.1 N-acetylmuramoyl-L-alanine amidase [Gelidibacter algens]